MTVVSRPSWKDAYDVQMALWRWERSTSGQRWLAGSLRIHADALDGNGAGLLAKIYATEEARLLGADPVYVSEGMCDVVGAAAETFAPEPLFPTDLLTSSGFVYFARPFPVLDRFETPTTIAAFSWAPILAVESENVDEERVEFETEEELRAWLAGREGKLDGVALTVYARPKFGEALADSVGAVADLMRTDSPEIVRALTPESDEDWPYDELGPPPPIVPMHLTPWWFGMAFEGNEVDAAGRPTGAAWWWKIVQTTFRLMQQQIAVRHAERPDRPQRRSAARLGFVERDVVVVRLRREKADRHAEGEPEPANYSHRFIVSGHWRNQWYPASKVHRQIWISPYVKGPEEAPLVVRPRRAFTWVR